jgi:hypothetical protein
MRASQLCPFPDDKAWACLRDDAGKVPVPPSLGRCRDVSGFGNAQISREVTLCCAGGEK